jgi:hypothetical protein
MKKIRRRLELRRATIRVLGGAELGAARGGINSIYYSCNCDPVATGDCTQTICVTDDCTGNCSQFNTVTCPE